ncbi:uncharacterized protein LOC132314139 [Cornus florida]|uniref:uncharacterized protein LOC132314139 n=1 Tax=Cornus florida TaxID=4283 RepID=UPI00289EC761|nr:uncharacterized protein LOC132314139 [Cornus florida]
MTAYMVSTEKTSPNDENSEDQDEAQTIENHAKDAAIIEKSDDDEVVRAEYQALIIGLQMANEMKITDLEIYRDFKLVINHLLKEYEVKKDDLVSYHRYTSHLLERSDSVMLEHIPRKENWIADVLANLATILALTDEDLVHVPICQ